jgi:hypothetical protein
MDSQQPLVIPEGLRLSPTPFPRICPVAMERRSREGPKVVPLERLSSAAGSTSSTNQCHSNLLVGFHRDCGAAPPVAYSAPVPLPLWEVTPCDSSRSRSAAFRSLALPASIPYRSGPGRRRRHRRPFSASRSRGLAGNTRERPGPNNEQQHQFNRGRNRRRAMGAV